jgi:hypothetical protein
VGSRATRVRPARAPRGAGHTATRRRWRPRARGAPPARADARRADLYNRRTGTRRASPRSGSFAHVVTLYYVLGIALAAWAVIVAALGIKFDRFPGGRGGERIVIFVSLLLVTGTIGSAIVLSAAEDAEHRGHESGAGSGQE